MSDFMGWAAAKYVNVDGQRTSEYASCSRAFRDLLAVAGDTTRADSLRVTDAERLVRLWVEQGLCREVVNGNLGRLRRLFRRAHRRGLVGVEALTATLAAEGCGPGQAPDHPPRLTLRRTGRASWPCK